MENERFLKILEEIENEKPMDVNFSEGLDFYDGRLEPILEALKRYSNLNHFELNGKLLEVSLMLGCDVYDLIEVKNEIVKNGGMNADDRHRLVSFGFSVKKYSGKDDFFTLLDEFILKFSDNKPIVTDGYVNSFGRKHKNQSANENCIAHHLKIHNDFNEHAEEIKK